MDRLVDTPGAARRLIDAGWDGRHARMALERHHGLRRRRQRRRLGLAAGLGLASLSLLLINPPPPPAPATATPAPLAAAAPAPEPAPAPPARQHRREEGWRWSPETDGTVVEVKENRPERVALVLRRGKARLDVRHDPLRRLAVKIDEVVLRVAGSYFSVERGSGRVGISVEEGEVHVSWPGGERVLAAGESGWYPSSRPRPRRRARPRRRLSRASPNAPRDTTGDLLRAMDLARSRGQTQQAVRLLRLVLQRDADDARAPLAAFTLGRLLLTRLHLPGEAARAFARARELAPHGSLAEDALAREVEAWARAGKLARARSRARDYLRRYPGGRRSASVRRHARLR